MAPFPAPNLDVFFQPAHSQIKHLRHNAIDAGIHPPPAGRVVASLGEKRRQVAPVCQGVKGEVVIVSGGDAVAANLAGRAASYPIN